MQERKGSKIWKFKPNAKRGLKTAEEYTVVEYIVETIGLKWEVQRKLI